jgi:Na+-transporting NADH:ubiquinone oxidoreductase subunit D
MRSLGRVFWRPLLSEHPVSVHLLGICSALAVTTSLATALVMSAAMTSVLVASNALISMVRRSIPSSTRLVLQMTIIATLVIVTNELIAAFAPAMSKQLSIFVSLIITNCIILGRAEAFAMTHGVALSAVDGLANGLAYATVLVCVGSVRELLAQGSLLGYSLLPLASEGGWFEPLELLGLPPAGFFLLALFVWLAGVLQSRRGARMSPTESTTTEVQS